MNLSLNGRGHSQKSLRILHVITRAEMGGSQVQVLHLLRGFKDEYELALATGERGFLTEEAERLGVQVTIIPGLVQPLRPYQDIRALVHTIDVIGKWRPNIVHCHTSKAGAIGRAAARVCGVPAVFTAHTWSFADGTARFWKFVGRPAERVAARWTRKLITVSESNRMAALKSGIATEEQIVTVHNGIEDSRYRANPGATSEPRIVMVARFAPQKNQSELLTALAGCTLPFRLTFIGDGPTRAAVEALARQLNLRQSVEFLGTRTDTDRLLGESSLFVLATNWEGFPITILEAMRAGLPVVATDVDGVSEAVSHNRTGLLYPNGDVQLLRENITKLLVNPDLRTRFGSAGRTRYEAQFTCSVMLRKTAAVYADVLAAGQMQCVLDGQLQTEDMCK